MKLLFTGTLNLVPNIELEFELCVLAISWEPCTVEPLNNGHFRGIDFVLCKEVVLFRRLKNTTTISFIPRNVSTVERLSLFWRVIYRRFHCVWHCLKQQPWLWVHCWTSDSKVKRYQKQGSQIWISCWTLDSQIKHYLSESRVPTLGPLLNLGLNKLNATNKP